MIAVLSKAATFIAMIIVGILLRKIGVFIKEDFHVISTVVMKVTLPAAIIFNFSDVTLQADYLLLIAFGFGCGAILMVAMYLIDLRASKEHMAFDVLNIAGGNIGNFTLPFVQSFLGAAGVVTCSIFDIGNAVICLGGAYSVAVMIKGSDEKTSVLTLLRPLYTSVPFVTYLIMIGISFAHISLPSVVLQFAETVGNANPFLSMLMIGVGFELSANKEQIKKISKILIVRYAFAITYAFLFYNFAPFDLPYRQALTILALGPIAAAVPMFTAKIKGDIGLSSAINSMSIIISITLITGTLVLIL